MPTYYVDATGGNDTTGDGSSGTPWATLNKAFTQINADSPVGTEDYTVNCSNGLDATAFTAPEMNVNSLTVIGDIPTDGSYTAFDTNLYYRGGYILWNTTSNNPTTVEFRNIQLGNDDASGVNYGIQILQATGSAFTFNRCAIKCDGASANTVLGIWARDSDLTGGVVRNCTFIGGAQANSNAFRDDTTATIDGWTVQNCTFYNWVTAVFGPGSNKTTGSNMILTNCVAHTNTTDFNVNCNNISRVTASYNCSEDGLSNDANHVTTTQSATQLWIDAANDDFRLQNNSSDLYDAGDDLNGTFTDDLKSDTRVSWDIGAFEIDRGAVYVNNATTLDGNEVLQTYPGDANWADTQIDMQTIPDKGALTGQLYVLVELPNGSVASRAVTVGGTTDVNYGATGRGIMRGVARKVG